jgi:hypothetical protein
MSSLSNNPLTKHFRQPVLYVKLPSNGRWYREGSLDMPVTGEIAVYAMTARDEITFKTPDALMNGASTVQVIESCCPSIKDAWKMPAVDLDSVLIAIRLATYGKELEFTGVCPQCGTSNEKVLDLSTMLERIVPSDWSSPVKIDGMEIILKPQSYEDFNRNNQMKFDEQRIMQVVQNDELDDEEKTSKFNKVFQRLIETGINQVGKSIAGIKLDDNTVVEDPEFIREFLENCERTVWEAIKEKLDEIKSATEYSNVTLTCENPECQKDFITPFVFEQSNFFG